MKKVTKLSCVLLLAVCILTASSKTSMDVVAASQKCPSCGCFSYSSYVYGSTYTNADYCNHQIRYNLVHICSRCQHGWISVDYQTQPHRTPNNNACVCGFVPPRR